MGELHDSSGGKTLGALSGTQIDDSIGNSTRIQRDHMERVCHNTQLLSNPLIEITWDIPN